VTIVSVAVAEERSAQPVLNCRRLYLRPIVAEDAAWLHALYSDREAMRFMDCVPLQHVADTAKRVEILLYVLPLWHATWVVVERTSDAVIGLVNYHHRENWNQHLEIGFALVRAYWRQGFMREAVAALIDHCFGCLDMNRVESTVNPGNVAAIRLLEGLGFRLEGGPMRGRQRVGSEFRDLSMFGLLREEWQKSTRSAPTLARLAAPVPQESMA
jgi:ribosomal-protein-alanine N-acetyltransferase